MRRFIIDTDTGSDDAVALLMAHRRPDVQVDAVTIVAGSVPVEMGSRNAGHAIELCDKETPVYIGCPRPLLREPHWAFFFYGPDGMGGMDYPAPRRPPEEEHAVDALIRFVRERPGEYTLVTLGPLTNIAVALRRAADLAGKIRQCYIMGGAAGTVGNISPAAEYNIWVDPEAARIVVHSGMPIVLVGWEHCRDAAAFDDAEMAQIRQLDTRYAHFTLDANGTAIQTAREWLGDIGLTLPGPLTMAIALDPSVCTRRKRHFVDVETTSELTRGMTVVDRHGVLNTPPNIDVCWQIDTRKWKAMLHEVLT